MRSANVPHCLSPASSAAKLARVAGEEPVRRFATMLASRDGDKFWANNSTHWLGLSSLARPALRVSASCHNKRRWPALNQSVSLCLASRLRVIRSAGALTSPCSTLQPYLKGIACVATLSANIARARANWSTRPQV